MKWRKKNAPSPKGNARPGRDAAPVMAGVPAPGWRIDSIMARRFEVSDALALNARYDAAQTTRDNSRHWAAADHLSAETANRVEVRRTLRSRARYEQANNPYAAGIVQTYTNDLVGTGPRLRLDDDQGNESLAETIAQMWQSASRRQNLSGKLRTAVRSRIESGEVFVTMQLRAGSDFPVLRLREADECHDPEFRDLNDGVYTNADMEPVRYRFLKRHPGSYYLDNMTFDYDDYGRESVAHLFRRDRPNQIRGIPELTPSLGLLAEMRRYRAAVLAACETQADHAIVMETDIPADGDADYVQPFEELEYTRRVFTALPAGYKLNNASPSQPAVNHVEYMRALIIESARPLSMPAAIALGDSSGYNYASGRLDFQAYDQALDVDRSEIEAEFLDRLYYKWVQRMVDVGRVPPEALTIRPEWMWDGRGHVDPSKEANADKTNLAIGTTTRARICAKKGQDWRSEMRQLQREQAYAKQIGLVLSESDGGTDNGESEETQETESRTTPRGGIAQGRRVHRPD